MDRYTFTTGAAAITGAAGGIGRALALDLAGRGSDLALIDRDSAGLAAVQARIAQQHPRRQVSVHTVDLSVADDFEDLAAAVAAEHSRIALLVNNAGVALGGSVEDASMADVDWVLTVDLRAPIAMTKAFLPYLRRTPGAHIANVSSLFGLVAPADQGAYAASKFGIRGFTQALAAELIPQGIGVTVVHPGGIATDIARNARLGARLSSSDAEAARASFSSRLTMAPEQAAAQIAGAITNRKERLVITRTAVIADLVARVLPARHRRLVARGLAR